ncbi:MAG: hypothetical protein R3F43_26815 [bacterium]
MAARGRSSRRRRAASLPAAGMACGRRCAGPAGCPRRRGHRLRRAVAYDGTYVWMLTASGRQQPYSTLVRRDADAPAETPEAITMYVPENSGLPLTGGNGGVNIERTGDETFFSFCGDVQEPGAFVVLDGEQIVQRDLTHLGIPGDGVGAALSAGPDGRPLFGVRGRAAPGLAIGADRAEHPLFLPEGLRLAHPGVLAAARGDAVVRPRRGGRGAPHRREPVAGGSSARTTSPSFGGWPCAAWRRRARGLEVATDAGVIEINLGTGATNVFNVAGTSGGLPGDDVRVVRAGADGALYAGTSAGVGIRANGSWTTLGADVLRNVDVRSLAVAGDGTLWIGTADGLFRRGTDRTITEYNAGSGLPVNGINALALAGDKVYAGTSASLAVGGPDGSFSALGFVDAPGSGRLRPDGGGGRPDLGAGATTASRARWISERGRPRRPGYPRRRERSWSGS